MSSSSNNKPFGNSNTMSILHNPCLWNIPNCSHGETNSMMSFSAKEVSFFGGEEENDNEDEIGEPSAKKRRLSSKQVEFLEKSFEVENKLEQERKVQLAQDLGLQPRQVAIWFQNRRARFKTKQLERDFDALRNSYDSLKSEYDALLAQNDTLKLQVDSLRVKLGVVEEKSESQLVKPEASSENEQSDLSQDEDDELYEPPLLFLPKLESCYYDEDDEPCSLGFAAAEDHQPFNFWPYDEQKYVM